MNRIMTKVSTRLLHRTAFWTRLSRVAFTVLTAAGFMFVAASANAACGDFGHVGSRTPMKLPMLANGGDLDEGLFPGSNVSIVGLWHVVYTQSSGGIFNETLDQWHSDGTEFENAYLPPDTGNICFGVWKTIAPLTVRLHHIGWLFTPGSTPPTASGTFTLDETNVVSRNGMTYTGSFTFKQFDNNGVQLGEVTGTIAATRITVN
jgi:hypothetical protein